MSELLLPKIYQGRPAKFLRFDGADKFIALVDGVEVELARDLWASLPDQINKSKPVGHRH